MRDSVTELKKLKFQLDSAPQQVDQYGRLPFLLQCGHKLHKVVFVQRLSVVSLDHKGLVFDIPQFLALAQRCFIWISIVRCNCRVAFRVRSGACKAELIKPKMTSGTKFPGSWAALGGETGEDTAGGGRISGSVMEFLGHRDKLLGHRT